MRLISRELPTAVIRAALAVFLSGFLLPLTAQASPRDRHEPPQLQVIAYIFPQKHVIEPGEVAASKLTRINYAFANIEDGRIAAESPADAPNFATLVGLKQQNPSLEVLISVGGWLWSGHFSDMALTHESRARFIDSAVAFIDQYKLDGLDIDWEFPAQIGAGNRFRPEDTQNYTLLLQELRKRFDHEQRRLGRRLLLSVAAGATSDWLEHTEMGKVGRAVDTVNLMAYDYYEPGDEGTTGNHAPLYTDPADPRHISADRSVHEFEQAGVPAQKIVLGVPFYGHVWGQVGPTNHGLFQPGKPVPGAYAGYKNIVASMLQHGFTRYWDAAASVPYLYNEQKQEFVSYEDPESLALKCAYVRKQGLGGIMFWEYNGDPSGALLNAINQGFHAGDTASNGGGR